MEPASDAENSPLLSDKRGLATAVRVFFRFGGQDMEERDGQKGRLGEGRLYQHGQRRFDGRLVFRPKGVYDTPRRGGKSRDAERKIDCKSALVQGTLFTD